MRTAGKRSKAVALVAVGRMVEDRILHTHGHEDWMIYISGKTSKEDTYIYIYNVGKSWGLLQRVRHRRDVLREPEGDDAGCGVWSGARGRGAGALERGVVCGRCCCAGALGA